MSYIASTLTCSNTYTSYGGVDMPTVTQAVTILGGANIASKHLVTPRGVITKVDDDQLKFLKAHPIFKIHQENGFVEILGSADVPGDVAAEDMTAADQSAPLTDAQLLAEGAAANELPSYTGKTKSK